MLVKSGSLASSMARGRKGDTEGLASEKRSQAEDCIGSLVELCTLGLKSGFKYPIILNKFHVVDGDSLCSNTIQLTFDTSFD